MKRSLKQYILLLSAIMIFCYGCATTSPIADASLSRDPTKVKELIAGGANVNQTGDFDLTALHNAASNGNAETLKALLAAGAKTELIAFGSTPMMMACYKGRTECVRLLISYGANVNAVNTWNQFTPLMYAAAYGRQEIVQMLLTAGADINMKDDKGRTAADYAQQYKRIEILAMLRKYGADVAYTGNAQTDIVMAAVSGDRDKIRTLLEQGTDPNQKDQTGKTLLMYAVENDWPEIVEALLQNKVNTQAKDKDGWTAVMHAARENKKELIDIFKKTGLGEVYSGKLKDDLLTAVLFSDADKINQLIGKGADVNTKYRFNSSLLNYSVNRDDAEITQLLLSKKADPDVFNDYGFSPLFLAITKDNQKIVDILLEKGADPNKVNMNKSNALMYALATGKIETAKKILPMTADINVKNKYGFSALSYAAAAADENMARALLERGAQPDITALIISDGRNPNYPDCRNPAITAMLKPELLRKQMLRAQAAVESANSGEDYLLAVKEYEIAKQIAPETPEIYYNLGMIYEKSEKFNDAILNLRHYLKLSPGAQDAQTVKDEIYKLEYKRENALR